MTALAWVAPSVVGLVILVSWIAARIHRRSTEARAIELASRPKALRDAKLVYMEKLFRVQTPIRPLALIGIDPSLLTGTDPLKKMPV